jgi:hypothetical protein
MLYLNLSIVMGLTRGHNREDVGDSQWIEVLAVTNSEAKVL